MARILVVDDEPDERFLVGRTLKREGHVVTVAGERRRWAKAAQEWSPDLAVTDVMMPVMDGIEFIRHLRGDPATAAIPILAASGDTHLAEAARRGRKRSPTRTVASSRSCRALLAEGCGRR